MLPLPCWGLSWNAVEPGFCSGEVFSKVAALPLWALSEEDGMCGSPSAVGLRVAAVWLPSSVLSTTSALLRLVLALRLFIAEGACLFLTAGEGRLQGLNRKVECERGT